MNAYELADFIDKYCEDNTSKEAAVLLRQQADRIAELEKQGKPVAWMSPDGKVSQTEGSLFYIPLFTTPQTKPLSDEEILNLYKETGANNGGIREFVRAIKERHGIK